MFLNSTYETPMILEILVKMIEFNLAELILCSCPIRMIDILLNHEVLEISVQGHLIIYCFFLLFPFHEHELLF